MNGRHEVFEQTHGQGHLEVRGGVLESALYLKGAPLIYDAADCAGSVGRFTCLLDDARPEFAAAIEAAAASGFANSTPLREQIEPLLALMPAGKYALTLDAMRAPCLSYAFDDYTNGRLGYDPYTDYLGSHYALADVYLGTQPESHLNDAIVNRYLAAIESGARPALIALGARDHRARFVLDGHHKLLAYWCCGVTPVVLNIQVEQTRPIPTTEAARVLADWKPWRASSYLKCKKRREAIGETN